MQRSYRIALVCGAVPLLTGISIYLLWWITRWEGLMMAGVVTLYGGLALVAVGAVALARFCWLAARVPGRSRRHFWLATAGCAGLLFLNFPAAGGIVFTVAAIETRYTVVVHNDSAQVLENARVLGGGCEESLGSIPPGGDAKRSFWIQEDGTLVLRASSDSIEYAEVIDGYVTPNMGGHTTVTVNPDATVSVVHDTES